VADGGGELIVRRGFLLPQSIARVEGRLHTKRPDARCRSQTSGIVV